MRGRLGPRSGCVVCMTIAVVSAGLSLLTLLGFKMRQVLSRARHLVTCDCADCRDDHVDP